jgi:cytochrome c-type biogenesis protein CcmH/NrfG
VLAITVVLCPTSTTAQTAGTVHGTVSDRAGQPVSGATVSVEAPSGRHETSSDSTGHFQHTDLPPGQYSVTAEKDALGGQVFRVLVHPGGSVDVRFVLEPGSTPAPWLRALPENRAGAAAFEAGVRANRAGDLEDAIAQFEAALRIIPTCVDCHFNIGVAYGRLERFEDAEASFREALRIRSDYAAAYYGLADIYSRQNRPEEAAAARGEANRIAVNSLAAGRVRAQDTLTRGIAFWNSGNVEDAVRQFRAALEADTTLVEPYYWLGLAYAASGDPDGATAAFSRYLRADPNGEHVDDATRRLAALQR